MTTTTAAAAVLDQEDIDEVKARVSYLSDVTSLRELNQKMQYYFAPRVVTEEKIDHLSSDEESQSAVAILRNCTSNEECTTKAHLLLSTYHALIDIHSLADLFRSRTLVTKAGKLVVLEGKRDNQELDGWAVLVKPNCGFEAKGPVTRAVRVAVQVHAYSHTIIDTCD